jgi:chemotaxis protein methyltransferase CheR
MLLIGLDRNEEAERALQRTLYLDRSLAVAHLALGSVLRRIGDLAGARRAYRRGRDLAAGKAADEAVPLSEGETAGRLTAAAKAQLALIGDDQGGRP